MTIRACGASGMADPATGGTPSSVERLGTASVCGKTFHSAVGPDTSGRAPSLPNPPTMSQVLRLPRCDGCQGSLRRAGHRRARRQPCCSRNCLGMSRRLACDRVHRPRRGTSGRRFNRCRTGASRNNPTNSRSQLSTSHRRTLSSNARSRESASEEFSQPATEGTFLPPAQGLARHPGYSVLTDAKSALLFCSRRSRPVRLRSADVAQLVERNLAKVKVAGSNPVVRSETGSASLCCWWSGREARQRPAKPCTRVRIPSPPRSTLKRFLQFFWTIGAAVARFPDTEEVTGSIPVSSTKAIGDLCLRKAQTASPSSFVRLRFACRVAGASPPAPPSCFARQLGLGVASSVSVGAGGLRHFDSEVSGRQLTALACLSTVHVCRTYTPWRAGQLWACRRLCSRRIRLADQGSGASGRTRSGRRWLTGSRRGYAGGGEEGTSYVSSDGVGYMRRWEAPLKSRTVPVANSAKGEAR